MKRDLLVWIQRRCWLRLLEKSPDVFHELVVVKVDANSRLKFVKVILFKKDISSILVWDLTFLRNRKSFDSLYHQVSWEVRTYKTDHLMIVKASDLLIVWCAVEYFPDLLQEALSIQRGGWCKRVLSQQNMFSFQSCIETKNLITNLKYLLIC